jgi:beta-glucosidase
MGYGVNQKPPHAPGTTVKTQKEVYQTIHHAILAHGLGCQAIRAASLQPCKVALVDNFSVTVPIKESPANIEAVYVDYKTQQRIPKASFDWYAECIKQNHVV